MNAERALTVFLLAFVAGSTALFVVLITVGALTDGRDVLRFGVSGAVGLLVALGVGWTAHRRASADQLTGR